MFKIIHPERRIRTNQVFSSAALRELALCLGLIFALSACSYTRPMAQEEESQVEYENYAPPPWAPPYDNVSVVRYYYFPDQEFYYDVWERQFWYFNGGIWISSFDVPPPYVGIDLYSSFVVFIDHDVRNPWIRHTYYRENYPRHGYDHYRDIVVHNRIVTNIAPGHELVPRAYNENNDRVTFMQHPIRTNPPGEQRDVGRSQPPQPGHPEVRQPQPVQHPAEPRATYHQRVHEVPMRAIAPSMPAESRGHNYGSGVKRTSSPPPQQPKAKQEQGHGKQ